MSILSSSSFHQFVGQSFYYRESHNGKYKGYVVEHPLKTKRFGKSKYTLEHNLILAKKFVNELEIKYQECSSTTRCRWVEDNTSA